MTQVSARGFSGGYKPGVAGIESVEFDLPTGTMVAVLGPNGGGKTTLFRALLGELPWSSGSISVPDRVGYVPQTERARLDFPVTAFDVVLMGTYESTPWYRRIGRRERRRAAEALERVGLADRHDTHFGDLSGGQRQRVLIARALTREAPVLLLDEPLSGVDRPSAQRIMSLLGELRDEGATILVSTHDIEQARAFDLVLCLNRAQIAYGPPAEALSPSVLERTYGGELILLADGQRAVVVQHHDHGDGHSHDHGVDPELGGRS
jgi:ABC-type Mn2+/Zn2+ transport system ATPase subunit